MGTPQGPQTHAEHARSHPDPSASSTKESCGWTGWSSDSQAGVDGGGIYLHDRVSGPAGLGAGVQAAVFPPQTPQQCLKLPPLKQLQWLKILLSKSCGYNTNQLLRQDGIFTGPLLGPLKTSDCQHHSDLAPPDLRPSLHTQGY